MTVEDSQDDIVCIDPSVIRQLRIQHGLDTSKEYEDEDGMHDGGNDDDEDIHLGGEDGGGGGGGGAADHRQCDDVDAAATDDDDDVLSESERLIDDVEALQLGVAADGGSVDVGEDSSDAATRDTDAAATATGAAVLSSSQHPQLDASLGSHHSSINMTYSPCDSQPATSPTSLSGNQKLAKDEDSGSAPPPRATSTFSRGGAFAPTPTPTHH
jgi:hypothetical protein